MSTIVSKYFDIGYMESLAQGTSALHQRDARALVLTTFIFIVTVVSLDKYSVSALMPFFFYPMSLMVWGGLPVGYVLSKAAAVSVVALMVGIFNPLLDRQVFVWVGPLGISGGWMSYISVLLRFLLTVTAVLSMVAIAGFAVFCQALRTLGVPKPFVVQLMFLYRYVFVLTEDALRIERARKARSFQPGAMRYSTYIPLLGHLLLRTFDRAERIYRAMRCRGFDGKFRRLQRSRCTGADVLFVVGWAAFFLAARAYNIPAQLGHLIMGTKG
ncbi:MAG: energy-coupling factor transporter transmembrane protein EcfT [Candidatus Omnitrophica bacterium]|nr:energy-coupling factor transporter transmembrane protein EcfT [Candidatus Omnitrophota bacterium]